MEQELVKQLYQGFQDNDSPREMVSWHASSIAKCPREQYFMRLGVPFLTQATGAKILRWRAGHLIEEVIRPELKKLMPNLQSNVRLTDEGLDLTGEFDNYDPDTKTIWEIKSVSHFAVNYRKVSDTRYHLRYKSPYFHHEIQQHAYVVLMEPGTVEKIGYLYITLDGLMVPYLTEVQPALLQRVHHRLGVLNDAWAVRQPPECICGKVDSPLYKGVYQYCNYLDKANNKCCDNSLLELIG